MKKRFLVLGFLSISLVLVLVGCTWFKKDKPSDGGQVGGGSTISQQLSQQSQIKKFKDYSELQEFLEQEMTGSAVYNYGGTVSKMVAPSLGTRNLDLGLEYAAPASSDGNETAAGQAEVGSSDYSQTNVQVAGVDEADIIKTDGKYIYAVVRNDLYIIAAYPADKAEIVSKIDFKSRPEDIYINGNKLVVFGHDQQVVAWPEYKNFKRRSSYAFLKVFDVADKKNPQQERDLDIEGSYANSRMIGDYIYFVTNNYNYRYIVGESVVPRILEGGVALPSKCEWGKKCFAPEVYYFDLPYDDYNFTTVAAVNLKDKDKEIKGDIYILSSNQNLYVSPDNIYITYTKYISEYELAAGVMKDLVLPRLSDTDKEKISKIEAADGYILNKQEKLAKVMVFIQRYVDSLSEDEQDVLQDELEAKIKETYRDIAKELEKTVVHKIAIDKDNLEYKTFGEVTGHVLNQFSMDESNGYFRIATTKSQTWSQYMDQSETKSYSNVYVLDKDLKVVGSVEKLAEGEQIYSARFMQNRAYLVTFRQTDPLFVIDLANPKSPKVLGQLKVPGFSNYLHPYDETTLIGFGKDTEESEWGGVKTGGLKLSLFDVSNVSEPKEIAKYVMGEMGSDSIALNDHKAFLFSKDKNLLVLPVSIRESQDDRSYGQLVFSGAAVFKVDKSGFTLRGKIDHSDGGLTSSSDYWDGYNYYDNTVKRSLYIDNALYTFSNNYLQVNKLDNLDSIKKLRFQKEKIILPTPEPMPIDFEVIN